MGEATHVTRSVVLLYGAEAIAFILAFILNVVIARLLLVEGYGQYAFVFAFAGILMFIADLGISPYMVREVAKKRISSEKYFGQFLSMKLFFGAVFVILGTLGFWIWAGAGIVTVVGAALLAMLRFRIPADDELFGDSMIIVLRKK